MSLEFLISSRGKKQLYHIWQNYWICIEPKCKATISTIGGDLANGEITNENGVHNHSECVCREDFLCREVLTTIKKRKETKRNTFISIIFYDEIEKLQKQHKLSAQTLAACMKDYSHFKSIFKKIREKVKPQRQKRN